jgi:adenosylhomocysteine nucleosidase
MGKTPAENHIPLVLEHRKFVDDMLCGTCGTGDSFETCAPKVECDVVDMEAYAFAKVCMFEKINFISLKYITDGADEGASQDWPEEVKKAGENLNRHLEKILSMIK